MIDGKGLRPGDVLTAASGKTVEVRTLFSGALRHCIEYCHLLAAPIFLPVSQGCAHALQCVIRLPSLACLLQPGLPLLGLSTLH